MISYFLTGLPLLPSDNNAAAIKPGWVALEEKSCVNEASEQVAFSDRLLLTKTDLCTEMQIDEVLRHLKHLNPFLH